MANMTPIGGKIVINDELHSLLIINMVFPCNGSLGNDILFLYLVIFAK